MLNPERLQALPQVPREEVGPLFAEPWQAQAFALAVKLSEQGHFTCQEWAAALTSELKAPFRCTALMSQPLRCDPTAPEPKRGCLLPVAQVQIAENQSVSGCRCTPLRNRYE